MPIKFHKGGCIFSIVASILLTLMLNVFLRAC